MVKIKIEINNAETLKQLNALSPQAYLAAWTEAVRRLAVQKANNLGSRIGPRVAGAITTREEGLKSEILLDGPDSRIGEHIHTGGPIRSSSGKRLAIPTRWNTNKDDFASTYGDNYFTLIRNKKKGKSYLYKKNSEGKITGPPMFVLVSETRPQKPRPWWPEDAEVETATVKFFEDNF